MEKKLFSFCWTVLALLIFLFVFNMSYDKKEDSFYAYFKLNSHEGIVHYSVNSDKEDTLFFECRLPEENIVQPYMAVSGQKPYIMSVEDEEYHFPDEFETINIKNKKWFLFPVSPELKGKNITLGFHSEFLFGGFAEDTENKYEILDVPAVCYGTRNMLLSNITMSGGLYMISSAVLICVAFTILLVNSVFTVVYKIKSHVAYIGFSFLCFGIWISCESAAAMTYFNGFSLGVIKCISIFIIPVLLFRYISLEFPKTYKLFFVFLSLGHFLLLIGVVVGMMCNWFAYFEIEQFLWFVFICSLLECVCCLSVDASENKRVHNLYIAITLVFFTFFIHLLFYNFSPVVAITSLVVGSILLIFYNLTIFIPKVAEVYRHSLERKNLHQQLTEQVRYYKILENKDCQYRKLRHDMKNHWQVTNMLLLNDRKEEALLYINKIQSELEYNTNRYLINTGNAFLDAIITAKTEYAVNNQIEVETEIMVVRDMKIDMMDNSIIFGNILDNAIEACQKVKAQKSIFIKMLYKKGMLVCCFQNSIDEERKPKGDFKTDKENPENHGIGLGNVREAVERYGGSLSLVVNENKCSVSFVLMDV